MDATDWKKLCDGFEARLIDRCPGIGAGWGRPTSSIFPVTALEHEALIEVIEAWIRASQAFLPEPGDDRLRVLQRNNLDYLEYLRFCWRRCDFSPLDPELLRAPFRALLSTVVNSAESDEGLDAGLEGLAHLGDHLRSQRGLIGKPDPFWLEDAKRVALGASTGLDVLGGLMRPLASAAARGADLDTALEGSRSAVADQLEWLQGLTPGAEVGWQAEDFADMCQAVRLGLHPAELHEFVQQQVGEHEVELRRTCERVGGRGSLDQQVAQMRAGQPASFATGLANLRTSIAAVRAFVEEEELAPLPTGERFEVVEVPAADGGLTVCPELITVRRWSRAQCSLLLLPGQREGSALTGMAPAELLALAMATAYPGDHLRAVVAHREQATVGVLPLRSALSAARCWAADLVQGWRGYVGEMMRDAGFSGAPVEQVALVHQLWVNARLALIDIELASLRTSAADALVRLQAEVGLGEAAALEQLVELRRAPGRVAMGLLGTARIFELRQEAKAHWQKAFSLKRFHAGLLQAGCLPLAHGEALLWDEEEGAW